MQDKGIDQDTVKCLDCGNVFTGKYCNICGQHARTQRLNLKSSIHNFFHAITHMEKGFLYSAKEMLIKPGHTTREYIKGKRAAHADPFLMLVILGGLASLLYYKLDIKMLNSFTISEIGGHSYIVTKKFFAISMLIYCFAFSLIDRIFFYRQGYNYIEILVFNIFIAVELLFLYIVLIPILLITSSLMIDVFIRPLLTIVVVIYVLIARYQFLELGRNKKARKAFIAESLVLTVLLVMISWKSIIALTQI